MKPLIKICLVTKYILLCTGQLYIPNVIFFTLCMLSFILFKFQTPSVTSLLLLHYIISLRDAWRPTSRHFVT